MLPPQSCQARPVSKVGAMSKLRGLTAGNRAGASCRSHISPQRLQNQPQGT